VWGSDTDNQQWRRKQTPHYINYLLTGGGTMPAKFKPSQKVYKRGVPASQLPVQHFYLKNTPKEELFAEINKSNVKPKQKQKR